MTQIPLPFREFRPLPGLHALWFHYANAADYGDDKKYWFYPFKNRLLMSRALPDGIDLQIIKRRCYCGDGIFRGRDHTAPEHYWQVCWRCEGTGIHRTDRVLLARYDLGGTIYHKPWRRLEEGEEWPFATHETLTGFVKHEHIPAHLGRLCFSRLLLRYEPREWLRWQKFRLRQWRHASYWRATPFIRFLRQMQADWRAITEEADDIPF